MNLRVMTESDLRAADELRQIAHWNQTPDKWRCLLHLEPGGCFVAIVDDRVVGTVTTTTYGRALAWIGMMLVHPDHRRRGIGTSLMRQALAYLEGLSVPCIKLDATPAGQPVYGKLGFAAESTLTRWHRLTPNKTVSSQNDAADTRKLADADWDELSVLDTRAFGAPRRLLLRGLERIGRSARIWPVSGPVRGYGLLRPGANAEYLGPVMCPEPEGAVSLLTALLREARSHPVVWDIPDENPTAARLAEQLGFEPSRKLTRMRRGPNAVAPDLHAQFAIADPAVG